MATISTRHATTIVERAAMNVDRAAVERDKRERAARAAAERIAFPYFRLFQNVVLRSDVALLRTENEAREKFRLALKNAENRLQVEILRVAVDNRWAAVVQDFITVWDGEHPISDTVQELWDLTTGCVSA